MASSNVATLSRYLRSFDLVALGEALGPQLANEIIGANHRAQATFERADLEVILGAAAQRGVARFIAAAETRAAVEGPDGGDDVVADVMAVVSDALSLLCVDPESADRSQRAQMATRGIHLLGQLCNRWDDAGRPD